MANTERYQAHCRVCFAVCEDDTLAAVLAKVAVHEAKGACVRPVYNGHDGVWLKAVRPA